MRNASEVLCNRCMLTKLQGKLYRTTIRPAMLYLSKFRAIKKQHLQKLSIAEIKMLNWMSGNTLNDRMKNENTTQVRGSTNRK